MECNMVLPDRLKRTLSILGSDFDVKLNYPAHKRVQEKTGIDMAGLVLDFEGLSQKDAKERALAGFSEFIGNFDKIISVCYWIIQPQLDGKDVSIAAFNDAIGGPELLAIRDAVQEALIDFLASLPHRQKLLMAAIAIAERARIADGKTREKMQTLAISKIESIERKMMGQEGTDAAEKMIRDQLMNSYANSPELSGFLSST
jgi:hypothetical protein